MNAEGGLRTHILWCLCPGLHAAVLFLGSLIKSCSCDILPHAETSHNETTQLPRLLGYQRDNYTNVPSEQWSYSNVLLFCVQWNALLSWNHSSSIPWCGSFIEYSSHNIQVFPQIFKASLVTQLVKNLPALWETWVRSPGWEDAQDKRMTTHSKYSGLENSILYSPWSCKEQDVTNWLLLHFQS